MARDERERKNKRAQLRRRLDPDEIMAMVNELKPVEEWDWEELQRGYPRAPSGNFGRQPVWADIVRHRPELQARYRTLASSKLRGNVAKAVDSMVSLMEENGTDLDGKPLVPAQVRLKAAEYIIDQVIGKATVRVQTDGSSALRELLAACMVNDNGEDAHPVIMGEILQDDEDEDEEYEAEI